MFAGLKREGEERRAREEEEARKQRQDEMKRSLGTKEFPVYAVSVAHSVTSTVRVTTIWESFIRGGATSGD